MEGLSTQGRGSMGFRLLKKFEGGERLTLKESVLAKCCECMGEYADGKLDCKLSDCCLYPWMPYRDSKPKGLKKLSPEHLKKLRDGLKRSKTGSEV